MMSLSKDSDCVCVCVTGPCGWSLHWREEAIDAFQVHAAYRLRHQSRTQVSILDRSRKIIPLERF